MCVLFLIFNGFKHQLFFNLEWLNRASLLVRNCLTLTAQHLVHCIVINIFFRQMILANHNSMKLPDAAKDDSRFQVSRNKKV